MKHPLVYGSISCLLAGLLMSPADAGGRKSKYGHYVYQEAPAVTLREAGSYRATGRIVRLRAEAAAAFKKMQTDARQDGFEIVPISGFRTISYQEMLFNRARKKHGSVKKAAQWVAPPGYSEHHTGWTLDLGDGKFTALDVDPGFEKSSVFWWLTQNARNYGFELSFPKDNAQGVSYEPWHWRFVGTDEARRLFHDEP